MLRKVKTGLSFAGVMPKGNPGNFSVNSYMHMSI